jgi:hypothetical protein
MADEPFYAPGRKPRPARQPKAGELLFEFLVGQARWRCELRDQGAYGVEAQFFENAEFSRSRRWRTREVAVRWAESERSAIQLG